MRRGTIVCSGLAIAVIGATPASAATQVGETFTTSLTGCTNKTVLQSGSSGPSYAAPIDGVVTSWSHQGNAMPSQLKLKVGRRVGPDSFTIVGESQLEPALPNQLNPYSGVRIAVRAGDLLGMYMTVGDSCARQPPGEWAYEIAPADVAPGETATFTPSTTVQLNVSAIVEPDCDGDGFGDETQDADVNSCPPAPETTITDGPRDKVKTRKKRTKATFAFTASEPGATFECALDNAAFGPCTSPHTVEVGRGPHQLAVRATDGGGHGGAPVTDDWKVKRKRK